MAELSKIGARAFVWGYPAVFMERMKRTMTTNVHQPLGAFQHKSKLSAPGDGEVVPNNDTLLSSSWIDLADDAWVLKVPDMGDRYYVLQERSGFKGFRGKRGKLTERRFIRILGCL